MKCSNIPVLVIPINNLSNTARLEALLFQYGNPIDMGRAAGILGVSEAACRELVEIYAAALIESEDSGLTLIRHGDTVQLVTKSEVESVTSTLISDEFREELTPATLETLTIVAYLGPIERADIDYIRGVNSSFTLRNLLVRGLVERDKEGRAYKYSVATEFLKHLGLKSTKDLPGYNEHHDILNNFAINEDKNNYGK